MNKCNCLCHLLPGGNKDCKCCLICDFCGETLLLDTKIINKKPCEKDILMPNIRHIVLIKEHLNRKFKIDTYNDNI